MASRGVTFYVQLVPEWAADGSVYAVHAAKMTQREPRKPLPGAVVVPVVLYADESLFGPREAVYAVVEPGPAGGIRVAEHG